MVVERKTDLKNTKKYSFSVANIFLFILFLEKNIAFVLFYLFEYYYYFYFQSSTHSENGEYLLFSFSFAVNQQQQSE